MLKKILSKEFIKQFISYFCVGGIAAIVEWVIFFIFSSIWSIPYLISTVFAFIFSTTVNWFLGKVITFKNSNIYKDKAGKEIFIIFLVSAIGLVFNLILMFLFVTVIGLNSDILMTFSKIMATGIVFFWNFLMRKFVVYKEK
jgi:putative flippase GtrA